MLKSPLATNPFAMLMDPAAVIQAMESSDLLGSLQRRICRPLDKPMTPRSDAEGANGKKAFDLGDDDFDLTDD